MEKKTGKKAVSPVITTVMLVLLVIILATIIFLWGTAFIPEALTKFDRPIEEKCSELAFSAELSGTGASAEVFVSNDRDVPIYRFGLKKEGKSKSTIEYSDTKNLLPGGTASLSVDLSGFNLGDELDIIPVLLGKTDDGKVQEYSCPELNWQILEIQ